VRAPGAARRSAPPHPINATWTVRITDPYGNVASVASSTPLEGVISGASEVASTGYPIPPASDDIDCPMQGAYTAELVGSVASGSRALSWRKFTIEPK
jgi:uncharacterized Zn-binding protein involved in type VI secretion